jgi:SAM-dependent methyltransferase
MENERRTPLLTSIFANCAYPRGAMGRAMLAMMNFGHAPLTNWGLGCIPFQDGWTILDVGCGGGRTLQRLLKRSKGSVVYGVDISDESVAKARKVNAGLLDARVFVKQGSAAELPYDDRTFDLVTAVETVYFWPTLPQCLLEVKRVLKPGGLFAILIEVTSADSIWTRIVEGMTPHSPEQLKDYLEQAGFGSVSIHRKKPTYAAIIGRNSNVTQTRKDERRQG